MKIEKDERRFDFHDIGLAIKRAREASGMTQEQLAYIVDRAPRTIMYNENDGQHPSLNTFYQLVTMFDISVDQYFYPSKNKGSDCRKRIDAMLNALDEKELKIVEAMFQEHRCELPKHLNRNPTNKSYMSDRETICSSSDKQKLAPIVSEHEVFFPQMVLC